MLQKKFCNLTNDACSQQRLLPTLCETVLLIVLQIDAAVHAVRIGLQVFLGLQNVHPVQFGVFRGISYSFGETAILWTDQAPE